MSGDSEFTTVFESDRPYEILLVLDALKEQGIPVFGQQLSSSGMVTALPQSPVPFPGRSWVAKVPRVAIADARAVIAQLPLVVDAGEQEPAPIASAGRSRVDRGTVGYWVFWLILAIFGWEVITSVVQLFT